MPTQKITQEILALFSEISSQTDAFAHTTGLQCKAGCGKCCQNPDIETTITEMLPLAAHLWETGQAQAVVEKIKNNSTGVCVLYQPDAAIAGNGRCSFYQYRPGICRLFGFAAKMNHQGQRELVTCRTIKEDFAKQYQSAQQSLSQNMPAPDIGSHTMKIFAIDPQNGKELLPVNKAIYKAIEKLSFSSPKL